VPRQPAGLRERKKERTRQALAAAAMRLFAERGYEATTVADIAAAAEVSTRTFFAYFPSKEDVFFAGTRERLDLVRQAFGAHAGALPPLAAMRATLDQIIATAAGDLFAADRDIRLRLLLERPELRARGTQLLFSAHQTLADGIRAGVPGMDEYGAVAAAGATIGALVAIVLHALEHGGNVDEVRAALTVTLDRLQQTMMRPSTAWGHDERCTDDDGNQHR
jgi:AcrR family transcriptional regulator